MVMGSRGEGRLGVLPGKKQRPMFKPTSPRGGSDTAFQPP